MYAIIRDRGRQYRVTEGDLLDLDLMSGVNQGDALEFAEVLMTSDGKGISRLGEPTIEGASVQAQVIDPDLKGDKIDVVHFHRRNDSHNMKGHRPRYTRVKIGTIRTAG